MMKKIILLVLLPITGFAQGWNKVGEGVLAMQVTTSTGVHILCSDTINNLLYVGGTFDTAGSSFSEDVAAWDGNNWQTLPAEQGPGVDAMVMYNGNLYVGGSSSNGVTMWDGKNWTVLPLFNNGSGVNSLCVFNDTLYAGGSFLKSGSTYLNYIAKWDGTNWQPVGAGFDGYASPSVNTMCVWKNKLYVGGFFDMSGTSSHVFSIAKWDSGYWVGLSGGVSDYYDVSQEGSVYALDTFQNNLYVGGDFGFAGGDTIRFIARWGGNKWNSLGNMLQADVDAMQSFKNNLYVGGVFYKTSGYLYSGIARWDGINWSSVDSGLDGDVWALATFQNQLYVGGIIDTVSLGYKNLLVNNIARWSPDTATGIGSLDFALSSSAKAYPNPTSNLIAFSSEQPINQVQVITVIGQIVLDQPINYGEQMAVIDVSHLPTGIYFYKLKMPDASIVTGKFVKE